MEEAQVKRSGVTVSVKTHFGTAHITMNDVNSVPYEVFITIGKVGSSISGLSEAIGRLISLNLKLSDGDVDTIVEQLSGIGDNLSMGFGKQKVLSLSNAIASTMKEHYIDSGKEPALSGQNDTKEPIKIPVYKGDLCPECGNASLFKLEGCDTCNSCGYSKCG